MEKLKELYKKYKEILFYLIFGVLTTVVNYILYLLFAKILNVNYMVATVLSQIIAIIFAYVTNKLFVFESKNLTKKELVREIISFFGFRGISLLLDMGFMYLFVDILNLNDAIMKLVSNVLIIIANYVFSKLFVFKRSEEKE